MSESLKKKTIKQNAKETIQLISTTKYIMSTLINYINVLLVFKCDVFGIFFLTYMLIYRAETEAVVTSAMAYLLHQLNFKMRK